LAQSNHFVVTISRRSTTNRVNRTLVLVSALGAGLMTAAGMAQTPAVPAPTPAASQPAEAPVTPQAIPAKIALVAFEQAVFATNEGQRAVQEIQVKYKPKKDQIDSLSHEVDTLKKQLQSAPATLSDADRAAKMKEIDAKEKRLNHDGRCADCIQYRVAGSLWQGCGEGLCGTKEVRQRQRLYAAARCQQPAEQRDVGESEHGRDAGCRDGV